MSLEGRAVVHSDTSSKGRELCNVAKSALPVEENVIVPDVTFKILDDYIQPLKLASRPVSYYRYVEKTPEELYEQVEYDMDEEDCAWLELVNEQRAKSNLGHISMDTFELLMDRFEKESFFQCQTEAKMPNPQTDEDAICAVCLDGDCYNNNMILFCDLCNMAVHQKCYGVPSIPDGSWVCQRCLVSPSKNVECCLCPNRRGAFKQSDDGRWVHVACALWIPEVEFGNATFLEPVIGISNIAAARWKLVCYICKQRGIGACIQCANPSCYTGFHVTCAQHTGLTMKKEHVKDVDQGTASFVLKKTAFCDEHSESFLQKIGDQDDKSQSPVAGESIESKNQQALKKARRLLSDNRNACLPLFYPVITVSSIAKISRKMSVEQKDAFISRLHCYWTLKRQSRNGMPLLRSRQFGNLHRVIYRNMISSDSAKENHEIQTRSFTIDPTLASKLKDCHRLRQDLEKVRLLIEQVRKRERMKLELVRVKEQELHVHLQPVMLLFNRSLDKMEELIHNLQLGTDTVGDSGIQRSEFLSKMRQKISSHSYRTLDDFEADLKILISNSQKETNERKTKELEELRLQGCAIVKSLCNDYNRIGYDPESGLHISNLRRETASEPADVEMKDPMSQTGKQTNSSMGSTEKSTSSTMPSGVNRRTAVLFSNKTRKSAKHCEVATGNNPGNTAKDYKPHRRPGRPPKLTSQKSLNGNDGLAARDRPFMLDRECIGFGDRDLAEKCAKRRSSTDNTDFAKVGDSETGKVFSSGATLDGTAQSRQSFISYQGSQADQSQSDSAPLRSSTSGLDSEVRSRRSLDARTTESFLQYRNMSLSNSDAESRSDEDSSSTSSMSDGETTSSQENSSESDVESMESSRPVPVQGSDVETHLRPLDLVWAKCRGYPWYPAIIIDPKTSSNDSYPNGMPIPVPPDELLNLQKKHMKPMLLVLFFDAKRTWQWLPVNKLVRLGEDTSLDQERLLDSKKPNVRRAVQSAYNRGIQHKRLVCGEAKGTPRQETMDTT